jgi:hypothetical protein
MHTWQRWSLFIRDKPILSSGGALRKDYDGKGPVAKEKNSGRNFQGFCGHDELIGYKPPVIK